MELDGSSIECRTQGAKMRRNLKRVLAIIMVVGLLGLGVARPAPMLAVDAEEGFLLATAALAGYVAIVVVGTMIVYRHISDPTATLPVDWQGRARNRTPASGLPAAARRTPPP